MTVAQRHGLMVIALAKRRLSDRSPICNRTASDAEAFDEWVHLSRVRGARYQSQFLCGIYATSGGKKIKEIRWRC